MTVVSVIVFAAGVGLASCGSARPRPAAPASRPAAPASRPTTRGAAVRASRALQQGAAIERLLRLAPGQRRSKWATVLISDWTRALQLQRAVGDALLTTPWGRWLTAALRGEVARATLLPIPWSGADLAAWGIDHRLPALYAGRGDERLLFSVALVDRRRFMRRLRRRATRQHRCKGGAAWRERRRRGGWGAAGQLVCGEDRDVLSCHFRFGRATCGELEEVLRQALQRPVEQSLWSRLPPGRRKQLGRAVALVQVQRNDEALGGLISVAGARVALDGWLTGGPALAAARAALGGRGRARLGALVAGAREALYAHVSPRGAGQIARRVLHLGVKGTRLPWRALTGEVALLALPATSEVAAVAGVKTAPLARRLQQLLVQLLRSPRARRFVRVSRRALGGRPAYQLQLKRGYQSYPLNVPLSVAAIDRLVALGSWRALTELVRSRRRLTGAGARRGRAPPAGALGFARLELGDPLASPRLAGLAAALGQLVVAQGRRRGSPYAASRALLALLRGARLELRGAARGVTFKGRLVGLQPLARLATADHRAYLGALAARFGGAARGGRARARLLAPYARALAWGRRGRGLLAAAAGSLTPLVLHAVRRRRLGPLTREAVVKIDHLRMAATMYYRRVVAKRGRKRGVFPRGTWTWTPARRCCAQPGGVCRPRRGDWRGKEWRQLGFAIRQPHRYQYRIRGRGRGTGALFEVEARGDLDCDGHYSSYKMEVYFLVSADGLFPRGPMTRDALE